MCFILAPFYSIASIMNKNLNAHAFITVYIYFLARILFIIFFGYFEYSKYSQAARAAAHALVGGLLGGRGRVRRLKIFSRKCMLKPTWKMNRDSARVQLKGEAEDLIPSSNMQ